MESRDTSEIQAHDTKLLKITTIVPIELIIEEIDD